MSEQQGVQQRRRGRVIADRSLAVKLGGSLVVLAVVAVAIAGIATSRLLAMADRQDEMYADAVVPLIDIADLQRSFTAERLAYVRLASSTEEQIQDNLALIEKRDAEIVDLVGMLTSALGADHAGLAAVGASIEEYQRVATEEYLPLVLDADPTAGEVANGALLDAGADSDALLNELSDSGATQASDIADSGDVLVRQSVITVWAALLGALVVVGGAAVMIVRQILSGLRSVQESLAAVAEGDLTRRPAVLARDEVGRMAESLVVAQDQLRATIAGVVDAAQTVAAATEELSASSTQVSASSQETATQAGSVAASAEQVSRSVQTVAAGAEQMGASIQEIAQNAAEAAKVAESATRVAETTNDQVRRLGEASQEIGNIVKVITSIAEQTNLLALNATIEAARAGEAGKGFAVVAGEVKELAQETAKATDDIARRVESIQVETTGAVAAIGEISRTVATINDFQITIASAVEEQTATTSEISRSVAEAATGSGEIATTINGVATQADAANQALTQVDSAVNELARMAEALRTEASVFRV